MSATCTPLMSWLMSSPEGTRLGAVIGVGSWNDPSPLPAARLNVRPIGVVPTQNASSVVPPLKFRSEGTRLGAVIGVGSWNDPSPLPAARLNVRPIGVVPTQNASSVVPPLKL